MLSFDYLNKIPFSAALEREAAAFERVQNSGEMGEVFGFETGPVITLGVRGNDQDLLWSRETIAARGFEVRTLDRGGQATLHNPGQLVIFPIVRIRDMGARAWVDLLLNVSIDTLRDFAKEVRCKAGKPGLYSDLGKVAAIGIRVRNGISTHGLAINVSNDLGDFDSIRPCGELASPVDRVGDHVALAELFAAWSKKFSDALRLG